MNRPTKRLVVGMGTCAAVLLAVLMLAVQVDVDEAALGTSRTCGSAFDALADRSGWETWWARDLDEPETEVRAQLPRTTQCPTAMNQRIAVAGGSAIVGVGFLTFWLRLRAEDARRAHRNDAVATRLARLGRRTHALGVTLTAGGAAAVILLVADADSTLFIYTDRLVVTVIGLIVLIPAIALVVLGRALTIFSEQTSADVASSPDPKL